jgi:hypothetical protein
VAQRFPLNELRGAHIGIDASHWLQNLIIPAGVDISSGEPVADQLAAALGGPGFTLEAKIEKNLEVLKAHEITPIFYFSGLDVAAKDGYKDADFNAMSLRSAAWRLYESPGADHAFGAVQSFGVSGSLKPEHVFRFLQHILWKNKILFYVAPYASLGQVIIPYTNVADFLACLLYVIRGSLPRCCVWQH